jgi:hypothetical protein
MPGCSGVRELLAGGKGPSEAQQEALATGMTSQEDRQSLAGASDTCRRRKHDLESRARDKLDGPVSAGSRNRDCSRRSCKSKGARQVCASYRHDPKCLSDLCLVCDQAVTAAVTVAMFRLVGSAVGAEGPAGFVQRDRSVVAAGQSGLVADATRLVHDELKAESVPPGTGDAAFAKLHAGSVDACFGERRNEPGHRSRCLRR